MTNEPGGPHDNALPIAPLNALRFEPAGGAPHLESYFLRANHPERALALWLKATIFAPRPHSAIAELWLVVFDGENAQRFAARHTVPFERARFSKEPDPRIEIADARFELGPCGKTHGRIAGPDGRARWDLSWSRPPDPLGAPLVLSPTLRLLEYPFPRSKLTTPYPLLRFDGQLEVFGRTFSLENWIGMQGHNWGREHAWRYAWGQCTFVDTNGLAFALFEGFSARLRTSLFNTPWISAAVVRHGESEARFDRLLDLWNQHAEVGELAWTLRMRAAAGTLALRMESLPERTVCLGYANPDGRLSYCVNSKLARVELTLNPCNDDGLRCEHRCGGALELLTDRTPGRFERVV